MSKRLGIAALVAVVALAALAGSASAKTLRGTVVHNNKSAHSFVVAARNGSMSAVHASRMLKPGSVVRVNARRLRNGTFALRHARVVGHTHHAKLRGVVTFVGKRAFVVSSTGSSVLVNQSQSDSSQTPQVGDQVEVDGSVDDNGDIEDQGTQQTGTAPATMKLEGTVMSVDATARTLSISADDDNQSGQTVTVDVPQSFDITKFMQGQEVELAVTDNGDGTFTLVSSDEDGNANQADNQQNQQGDDGPGDDNNQAGDGQDDGGHDGAGSNTSGSGSSTGDSGSTSDNSGSTTSGSGDSGSNSGSGSDH